MTEYLDEKEASKAKKIRRILLLKIDRELKSDSNKNNHLNIMINSKKPQELNKAYNSYKILLSETTKTYSNFVELIDESFPKKEKQIKTKKVFTKREKHDQLANSMNSSFESQIQVLEYIPNKIDLGEKKFIHKNKDLIKNLYSPDFGKEIKLEDNQKIDDVIHNTIGAGIGAAVYYCVQRIKAKKLN